MNFIALFAAIIENLENLKYHNSQKKQEFRLKNINERRNYSIEEINRN